MGASRCVQGDECRCGCAQCAGASGGGWRERGHGRGRGCVVGPGKGGLQLGERPACRNLGPCPCLPVRHGAGCTDRHAGATALPAQRHLFGAAPGVAAGHALSGGGWTRSLPWSTVSCSAVAMYCFPVARCRRAPPVQGRPYTAPSRHERVGGRRWPGAEGPGRMFKVGWTLSRANELSRRGQSIGRGALVRSCRRDPPASRARRRTWTAVALPPAPQSRDRSWVRPIVCSVARAPQRS